MTDQDEMARVWAEVESLLPDGWELDGLRCASTGLTPGERSEEWVAVAVGPQGQERAARSAEPLDALRRLPAAIGSLWA